MLILVALDDVSGDKASYAIEKMLNNGANNVHVTQTITKKGRIGLLFLIDVDEKNLNNIGEVVMTELGSTGYNVIETKHFHANIQVAVHKVIIRSKQKRYDGTVRIKSSFTSKGKQIKVDPESDDLLKIIEEVKEKLGKNLTLRDLKENIQKGMIIGREETILELSE